MQGGRSLWLRSIGHNARLWRAFPARSAVPGCFVGRAYRSRPSLKTLEAGASIAEIAEWFDVTAEQITAVLDFVAQSLARPCPDVPIYHAHPL